VKFSEFKPGSISYRNPDAGTDFAYLRRLGKGRIAYLFGHPSTSVTATVALFAGMCDALGLEDGDGIALDHEVTDGLSAAQVSQWARDVLRLLERALHRRPVCYTYLSFAWAGNCAGLGGYDLWISDPGRPPGYPRVPAPWNTWRIHQWGVTGIDRDLADWPSLAAMRAAIGRPRPKPPRIEEDPMLLFRGVNAETPLALPEGTAFVRFYAGPQHAELRCHFPSGQVADVHLTGTSEKVLVPAGEHGVSVIRLDDGAHEVCAVASA